MDPLTLPLTLALTRIDPLWPYVVAGVVVFVWLTWLTACIDDLERQTRTLREQTQAEAAATRLILTRIDRRRERRAAPEPNPVVLRFAPKGGRRGA